MSNASVDAQAWLARARGVQMSRVLDFGIVLAFVALFLTLSVTSTAFLTKQNLLNLVEQTAPIGIMACGGTFVLIARGLDLSVGAIFTLAAILGSKIAVDTSPMLGILGGVALGGCFGAVNGLLVTVGRINAFIATITTGVIFAGVAQVVTSGTLVNVSDPSFSGFATNEVIGVKLSVFMFVAAAIVAMVLLNVTTFGRRVFAIGGGPEAARLSGVRVNLIRASTFVLSGLCAGLAGMIVASRTSSASVTMGANIEFDVIAAMLLGGISVQGGEGAIWRTVIGVVLLAMIDNGLTLLTVSPDYQSLIKGGIILTALALDARFRARAQPV